MQSIDRLSLKAEKCAACKADGKPLQDCGGCRSIKYCSRECQLVHRKEHKVDCNILKYEKMAYKRWCLDQDVEDGLYDLREDTREECPICMIGIPEPESELSLGLDITHCCFQSICQSCKYSHAQAMKKDNLQWLVKSKYYANENRLTIDVGTDDPKTWKNTAFHCPFCRVSIASSKEEFRARRAAKLKGKTDAQVCPDTLYSLIMETLIEWHNDESEEKWLNDPNYHTKVSIYDQKKYLETLCRAAYLGHSHALKLLAMVYMGANRAFDFNQLGIPVDLRKASLMLKASAKFGKVGCASTHTWLVFECSSKQFGVNDAEEPSWLHEKRNLLHLKAAAFYGDEVAVERVRQLDSLKEGDEDYKDVFDEDLLKAMESLGYETFDPFAAEVKSMYKDYCERVHSDEREQYKKLTKPNLGVIPTYDEIFEHVDKIVNMVQEKTGCDKPVMRYNIEAITRLTCGRDMTEEEKAELVKELKMDEYT